MYRKVHDGARQWPNYFRLQLPDRIGVGRLCDFSKVGRAMTDLAGRLLLVPLLGLITRRLGSYCLLPSQRAPCW